MQTPLNLRLMNYKDFKRDQLNLYKKIDTFG